MPGTNSKDAPAGVPQPPILNTPSTGYSSSLKSTASEPVSAVIPTANVPKLPATPQDQPSPPPASVSPQTASATALPPPKPRKRRRFRRFLLYTTALLGLGYAGGIYYALINDDFHDYFTDYIPGGEDAVLFFEERAFKQRFPNGTGTSSMYPQVSGENKVTITGKSGASPRVASKTPTNAGKSGSAPSNDKLGMTDRAVAQPAIDLSSASSKATEKAEKAKEALLSPSLKSDPKPSLRPSTDKQEQSVPTPAPAIPTHIAPIDPLNISNAADPAVQKVAAMLNDLIMVVNGDNASGKYGSTLTKAKEDVQQLANEIGAYKSSQQAAAQEQIKKNDAEFDRVAKEMLGRAQQAQKEQELRWREEYENERQRLAKSYDDKLKAELDAAQKVSDQKLRNDLLRQNLKMQDSFADTIRQQVETERDARLSKLNELSTTVSELEKLTTEWNSVVDANLQTQHLVVAVDAVRTALETADRPTPFLHELAALKESAHNNGTVNAAIVSIRPITYQKGIPTIAQLIDRFRRVASEVRKASLLPEDAGVASHAASFVLSKVLFKKQGLTAGSDVESVLTRTETLLEEGDLDEAAREMNGLTGWARVLSDDWLTDCRRVLEVKQAIEVEICDM